MREIAFDLGAPVRSKWPWQGSNMKVQALNGNDIDVRHFVCSAPCALGSNSSWLGQRPLEDPAGGCPGNLISSRRHLLSIRKRNSILSQLTEKRDRCQSDAATAIPSATNAAHDVCLRKQPSDVRREARDDRQLTSTSASILGITACEPLEATDCAPAAQQGAEERIGRLDGAVK